MDSKRDLSQKPSKKIVMDLECEGCGLKTDRLYMAEDSSLHCYECDEAHERRERLLQADKEFGEM